MTFEVETEIRDERRMGNEGHKGETKERKKGYSTWGDHRERRSNEITGVATSNKQTGGCRPRVKRKPGESATNRTVSQIQMPGRLVYLFLLLVIPQVSNTTYSLLAPLGNGVQHWLRII